MLPATLPETIILSGPKIVNTNKAFYGYHQIFGKYVRKFMHISSNEEYFDNFQEKLCMAHYCLYAIERFFHSPTACRTTLCAGIVNGKFVKTISVDIRGCLCSGTNIRSEKSCMDKIFHSSMDSIAST